MPTDEELIISFEYWLDHYTTCGDKHYSDTPDWKIIELYYDQIINRVLQDLPEMTDEENDEVLNTIAKYY